MKTQELVKGVYSFHFLFSFNIRQLVFIISKLET